MKWCGPVLYKVLQHVQRADREKLESEIEGLVLIRLHLSEKCSTIMHGLKLDPLSGANQVDIFLEDHGGPGVQHVGLYTPDIMTAVAAFKQNGVQFVEPPPAYYTDVCNKTHIIYKQVINLQNFKNTLLQATTTLL
jgi:4-hydroxyphenylpyruvate dioxygenase-like putative hemolysin